MEYGVDFFFDHLVEFLNPTNAECNQDGISFGTKSTRLLPTLQRRSDHPALESAEYLSPVASTLGSRSGSYEPLR